MTDSDYNAAELQAFMDWLRTVGDAEGSGVKSWRKLDDYRLSPLGLERKVFVEFNVKQGPYGEEKP